MRDEGLERRRREASSILIELLPSRGRVTYKRSELVIRDQDPTSIGAPGKQRFPLRISLNRNKRTRVRLFLFRSVLPVGIEPT